MVQSEERVGASPTPNPMLELICQASVPRDVFPQNPPGPEGSNGTGLLRVQWVSGAWLKKQLLAFSFQL